MNKEKMDIFEMILETAGGAGAAVAVPSITEPSSDWKVEHPEGQLAIDVGATKDTVVIVSTMAGADTTKIEVYVHGDLLTIRGTRQRPSQLEELEHIYYEECYWGMFSRTVVLPVDVKGDLAHAEYTNGILVVHIPKQQTDTRIPITIIEE